MARATKSGSSTGSPRTTATTEDAPKRKRGRPPGSKAASAGRAAASPKTAPTTRTRRGKADAAPAARMNKAELELQVAKLERTVARLRSKNKELKIAASEAREHADSLEAQLASRPTGAPGAKPSRRTVRGTRRTAATGKADDLSDEETED